MAKKKSSKPSKKSKPSKMSNPAGKGKGRAKLPAKPGKPSSAKAFAAATKAAYATAFDPKKDSQERQAALTHDPTTMCESPKTFASVLMVLRNPNESIDVRLTAMQAIGMARFSAPNFKSVRSEYIAALRAVAEDANPELRQRALGTLAREKDGFAQKKLIAGLKDPDKALVPPEKALQLLGYDIHSDAYPIAREIVAKPPNALAKQEALRLLASDANSAPLLETLLRDKSEPIENRQICAAALHVINPPKYQEQAREMLLDKEEHPDMQAMSLTAMTYFGDKVTVDQPLLARVDELHNEAPTAVKAMAKQFLTKYQ